MKNYNRRDFLKLTGASALALALAACGGSPSGPAAPTKDAQTLLKAINAYRESNGLQKLTYNKNLEDHAKLDVQCFTDANSTTANLENWRFDTTTTLPKTEYQSIVNALTGEGFNYDSVAYYGTNHTIYNETLNNLYPETETDLNTQMADMVTKIEDRTHIGIALVRIGGNLYWYAVALKKTAGV